MTVGRSKQIRLRTSRRTQTGLRRMHYLRGRTHRQAKEAARSTSTRFPRSAESWQKSLLGKERAPTWRRLTASHAGLSPNRFNLLDHPFHLAMPNGGATVIMVEGIEQFREVTWARTNIQHRHCDTEDVVNLARMHQPHES